MSLLISHLRMMWGESCSLTISLHKPFYRRENMFTKTTLFSTSSGYGSNSITCPFLPHKQLTAILSSRWATVFVAYFLMVAVPVWWTRQTRPSPTWDHRLPQKVCKEKNNVAGFSLLTYHDLPEIKQIRGWMFLFWASIWMEWPLFQFGLADSTVFPWS